MQIFLFKLKNLDNSKIRKKFYAITNEDYSSILYGLKAPLFFVYTYIFALVIFGPFLINSWNPDTPLSLDEVMQIPGTSGALRLVDIISSNLGSR